MLVCGRRIVDDKICCGFYEWSMKSAQPVKSGIVEKQISGGSEWEIPAKRGVGCFMIFGCVFCLPPLLLLLATIFGMTSVESSSVWGMIGLVVFACLFLLVGGAVAYFGYKSRYTAYRVMVRGGEVEVVKIFSKGEKSEKVVGGNVRGVGLYSSSETNGKPNYGILVRAREGDDVRFGVGLKEDELRWLASEMLGRLAEQGGLPTEEDVEEMYFSSIDGGSGNFSKGGVAVTSIDEERFVIEKDGSKTGKGMLFGGLFGMIFGSVFIWVGFWADNGPMIFGIVGGFITLATLVVFIIGVSKLGTSEKFTFESDRVIREKLRGGVSRVKIRFEKSGFNKVEVKSSGSSNDDTRYSVVLLGVNEKLKLFSWVDEDVSSAVKYKVNGWLKPEVISEPAVEESVGGGYGSAMVVEKTSVKEVAAQKYTPEEVPIYNSTVDIKDVKGGIWMLRLFLGVFLVVGLGLVIFGVSEMMKAKDSENWPSVTGVVLKSKVSVDSSGDGTTYGADVTYRYKVKGKRYQGDKVTVSEVSTSSRGRAQKIVKRYPKKKKVAVYYDPEEPETSVLEKGVSGGSWLMPGVGAMFLIIPLIMLILAEKHYRKSKREEAAKGKAYGVDSVQDRYGKVK